MGFKRHYFLLAPDYHGATVFSKILSSHPGITSLGDTYPSNRFDQTCGCGLRVSSCPFWNAVSSEINAERYKNYPNILPNYPPIIGVWADWFLYNILSIKALRKLIRKVRKVNYTTDYSTFCKAVYRAGCDDESDIFLDGVKSISRVKALAACGFRVDGVIHLVRKPGDYCRSVEKNKSNSRNNKKLFFVKNMLVWKLYHKQVGALKKTLPYLKIDYEDFVLNTDEILEKVFGFMETDILNKEKLSDNYEKVWHFMGNASLFKFDGNLHLNRYKMTLYERLIERLFRMI